MRASRLIVTALAVMLAFAACEQKPAPRTQLASESPGGAYASLTDVEQLKDFLRARFLPYPMMADHLEVVLGAADEIIGASLTRTKAPWYPEDIGMILTRLIEKAGLPGGLETKSQRVAFVLTAVTGLNDYVGNLLPDTCSRVQYSSAMASHLGKVFGSLLLKSKQLEELAPLVYQELILVRGGISPRNCRQSLRYATARSLINGGKAGGMKTAALVTVVSALVKEEIRLARVEGVSTATLSNSLVVWENRVLENNAALSGTEGLVEELRVSVAASASEAAIDVATSTSTSTTTSTSNTEPAVAKDVQQIGEFCGGDGVADSPYKICNLATLKNVANHLEASFIITKDIYASATAFWDNGAGWTPLGTSGAPFSGSFDGQDHVISGLTIHRPSLNGVGFVGYASASSVLQNIRFTNMDIQGKDYVGGLGGTWMGRIHHVSVNGSVRGNSAVGGMVGYLPGAAASIVDSDANTIAVTGTTYLGGLAGQVDGSASITRSWSSGTVTGDPVVGSFVGGLVGSIGVSTISHSYSSASVSTNNRVGGLIGYSSDGTNPGLCTIEYSHASGNVLAFGGNPAAGGGGYAGGLVGYAFNSCLRVQKSYATGNVTSLHTYSNDHVGGLVGSIWVAPPGYTTNTTNVEDSYATGMVTSSSVAGMVGGLMGWSMGEVTVRSYASGAVNAPNATAAGFCGRCRQIHNSFSTGVVDGIPTVLTNSNGTYRAGFVGLIYFRIINSYWLKPAGSPYSCFGYVDWSEVPQCSEAPDRSFFSQTNNAVLSTWDFINVWYIPQPGALPLLRE